MKKYKLIFLIYFFLISFTLSAVETELLKPSDVNKVMQQIFQQHVSQKEMSETILKHSFSVYIDQFDPFRMYLLDKEARPFLDLNKEEMGLILNEYKENDFTLYQQLNQTIQKAILRGRQLRKEVMQDKTALFNQNSDSKYNESELDPDLKIPFATNLDDLKQQIKQRFIAFINAEKQQFGQAKIMQNQDKTLEIYDHYLEGQEDNYLFTNEDGKPFSPDKKENMFVFHILKALTSSLDAHTTFYNNAEAYDMKVRLEKEFEGIGVVLKQNPDGYVVIEKVIEGGPADKSKEVQAGDRILEVNGTNIKDLPLDRVMEFLRGKKGTSVTLILGREQNLGNGGAGKRIDVNLTRAPIAVNEDRVDTSYEKFGDGIIGKITLHSFYQGENGVTSENDVRKAIKELSQKGHLKGLILDLRENSGGFLTQAVKVAGLFITNGVVVISKYSNGQEHFYRDMDGKMAYNGPLVVLTSKATASAAEIVAQALQDYGVAVIVGDEQTYGKGTIQSQTVTDDTASSYFKVTIGTYYTVSGKTPQLGGVKSDILVPGPYNSEHIGEKYLEYTVQPDKIPPEYKDDLSDVDAGLKAWYLRYYIPTIQHKINDWISLLPQLKQNSATRLANNKKYQSFLNSLNGKGSSEDADKNEIGASSVQSKNLQIDEMQMAEAVNIVKDMIMLHPQARENAYAKKVLGPVGNNEK